MLGLTDYLDVDVHVAVGEPAQPFDEFDHPRTARTFVDRGVKGTVGGQPGAGIGVLLHDLKLLAHRDMFCAADIRNGDLGRQRFDRLTHFVEFLQLCDGHPGHHGRRVRHRMYETFSDEDLKGIAYGNAADAEPLGGALLRKSRARPDLTLQDLRPQLGCDPRRGTCVCHSASLDTTYRFCIRVIPVEMLRIASVVCGGRWLRRGCGVWACPYTASATVPPYA